MSKTEHELAIGLEVMHFTLATMEFEQNPKAKVIMLKSLHNQTELAIKLAEALAEGKEFKNEEYIQTKHRELIALQKEMHALRAESEANKQKSKVELN